MMAFLLAKFSPRSPNSWVDAWGHKRQQGSRVTAGPETGRPYMYRTRWAETCSWSTGSSMAHLTNAELVQPRGPIKKLWPGKARNRYISKSNNEKK